jgi:hypothetical protein
MFGKRKKEKSVDLPEDDIQSFSCWTPLRKVGAIAAIAAFSAGVGYAVDSCDAEFTRKRNYDAFVQAKADEYGKATEYAVADETCLKPGTAAKEYSDIIRLFGVLNAKSGGKVIGGRRTAAEFCIRPSDAGQDISLESRLRISGMSYGDFAVLGHSAELKIESQIPAILPYALSVHGVSINGRKIPSSYLSSAGWGIAGDSETLSLDIAALVKDGILSRSDFSKDLELRVDSGISIRQHLYLNFGDTAGVSAYRAVSGRVSEYTKASSQFPSQHPKVKDIVKRWKQPHGNVYDIIMYALDETDLALEYSIPGAGPNPIDAIGAGKGKCTDYANVFISIMRAFGVPARYVEGYVLSGDGKKIDGRHAWAEVLVPFNDKSFRWVIVEPTWADNSVDPYGYIHYPSDKHMYAIGCSASLDTDIRSEVNFFQEHIWKSVKAGK